jgi:two-component system, NtrC family, response regulator AtoC
LKNRKILVIDDNVSTLKVIKAILEEDDYAVFTCPDGVEALEIVKHERVGLILLDLKMPGISGIELFKKIRELDSKPVVMIMTAHGTVESAVQAMKLGVENYLEKPLNFDELKITITKIFEKQDMREDLALLKGQRDGEDIFENMVGKSKKMRELFKRITSISKVDSTVLITGESGTGKEMVAKAIHNLSNRKNNKMISINIAAIPEGLQESELFGYEKGAFTGASGTKPGKFEIADNGTIFLDEIGNTSYNVQAKLLRVIEEKKVEPLGSNRSRQVDVRIVSATNADLNKMVEEGRFREDLMYRLNVVSLHLPPLRERRADIPLLVDYFLREHCVKHNIEERKISDESLEKLMQYEWPGNIRELRNVIEEAVVISGETLMHPDQFNLNKFGTSKQGTETASDTGDLPLYEMEKKSIIRALIKTKGNQTKAAKLLGVTRKILMNKIEKYSISNIVPVRTKKSNSPK